MEVREVNKDDWYIIYYCPECEEKYGFKVEQWLKVATPYNAAKYKRVEDFANAHKGCFVPIWERKEQ